MVFAKACCFEAVPLSLSFHPSVRMLIHSSGQILLPWYLMNSLSNFDKTDREYSLAPTDDLIRFCRSKFSGHGHTLVRVYRGKRVYIDTGASKFYLLVIVNHMALCCSQTYFCCCSCLTGISAYDSSAILEWWRQSGSAVLVIPSVTRLRTLWTDTESLSLASSRRCRRSARRRQTRSVERFWEMPTFSSEKPKCSWRWVFELTERWVFTNLLAVMTQKNPLKWTSLENKLFREQFQA